MIQRMLAAAAMLLIIPAYPLCPAAHGDQKPQGKELASIVDALKDRYGEKNFSADFHQESTLSAMDISDTAGGEAWFSHPGRMRWEYRFPDRHVIVTDGETLWIHRPEENQVVKGDAVKYFGDGKGAGFLSNFSLITEAFDVRLADETQTRWRLELVPRERHYELSAIYLEVNKETTEIEQVVTENEYGDTTTISFKNLHFSADMDPSLFEFKIPEGTDVIYMDE